GRPRTGNVADVRQVEPARGHQRDPRLRRARAGHDRGPGHGPAASRSLPGGDRGGQQVAQGKAVAGTADQLLHRLRGDLRPARAAQGRAGRCLRPEGLPQPVPVLQQCAGIGHCRAAAGGVPRRLNGFRLLTGDSRSLNTRHGRSGAIPQRSGETTMTKSRIAIALATSLMFTAGAAMANDPVNDPVDTQAQATHEAQDADAVQDAQVSNTDVLDEMDSDQPVEDTWITTRVKSSLRADTDTSGLQIEVETNTGVVGLSGQLDSQEQVDAAVRIAEGIEGVVEVDASDLNYGTMADYEQ